MQVVIEIDDHLYNQIFSDAEIMIYTGRGCGKTLLATLLRSIRIGTPLPKGHGRLIDAKVYEQDIRKHYFDATTVIRCTEIALDNASTIIEEDMTEEGEANADRD